jgi:hypothetical protein
MRKIMLMMAVAAFALSTGNLAQARLGWTLEDCQKLWGVPTGFHYYALVGKTMTTFSAGNGLYVEVLDLEGVVQCIRYLHRDETFLVQRYIDFLVVRMRLSVSA